MGTDAAQLHLHDVALPGFALMLQVEGDVKAYVVGTQYDLLDSLLVRCTVIQMMHEDLACSHVMTSPASHLKASHLASVMDHVKQLSESCFLCPTQAALQNQSAKLMTRLSFALLNIGSITAPSTTTTDVVDVGEPDLLIGNVEGKGPLVQLSAAVNSC